VLRLVPIACMPSPLPRQVGWNLSARTIAFASAFPRHVAGRLLHYGFGACSAFTYVTACTLAKSPSDSLHQRLRQSRCLHCRSDCYRVERTSFRAGIPPLWTTAFSRRTRVADNSPENRHSTVRERSTRLILPVTAQSGEPVPKGGICRGKRRWLL
jgi:hypothetical protein